MPPPSPWRRTWWTRRSSAEAVEAAKAADVAVLFLGLPEFIESEGFDRKDMAPAPDASWSWSKRIAAGAEECGRGAAQWRPGGAALCRRSCPPSWRRIWPARRGAARRWTCSSARCTPLRQAGGDLPPAPGGYPRLPELPRGWGQRELRRGHLCGLPLLRQAQAARALPLRPRPHLHHLPL